MEPTPPKRIFDINPPSRAKPSPTSRPVIVGHHPQAADPMVMHRPTAPRPLTPVSATPAASDTPKAESPDSGPATISYIPASSVPSSPQPSPPSTQVDDSQEPVTDVGPMPALDAETVKPGVHHHHESYISWIVVALVILLTLLIGAYLAIDAGWIRGASHLPFHIFQQQ